MVWALAGWAVGVRSPGGGCSSLSISHPQQGVWAQDSHVMRPAAGTLWSVRGEGGGLRLCEQAGRRGSRMPDPPRMEGGGTDSIPSVPSSFRVVLAWRLTHVGPLQEGAWPARGGAGFILEYPPGAGPV